MKYSNLVIQLGLVLSLISCKAYKQDIMFKLNEDNPSANLSKAVYETEQNYKIQTNDWLRLDVFTNKGELIIDPNFELRTNLGQVGNQIQQDFVYLVQDDGYVKFPIIEKLKLEGKTIDEAEKILEEEFRAYYIDPFVKLQFDNKRVILLGGNGGMVIPIRNENTSLVEILAQSGGLELGNKAQNIKIIRGDLNDPQVFAIDLTTVDGMKSSVIRIHPGDIIYVEPWRRVWLETFRDLAPVFSVITSVLTLAVVIQNL